MVYSLVWNIFKGVLVSENVVGKERK